MKKWMICFLVAALLLPALQCVCPPGVRAEDTLLPPSALMVMQSETLRTGDFFIEPPDATFNKMDAMEVSTLYDAIKAYKAPESSLLVNDAQYYYYYDHLEPVAREIYDLILQVARDPVSEGNVAVMMTPVDPASEQFRYAYYRASFAVTFDHPELFWLYCGCGEAELQISGDYRPINGRYTVFFKLKEPFRDFEAQMTAFNEAARAFLADVDRGASQHDVVLQIHDKLIDMVTYDMETCEKHGTDLAHTAYGALVKNSSGLANFAVCDGYALAFEYLLQQCGIPVAFIGGYGGPTPLDMGGHAWSIVNVDGEWFEVDSTWDDNQIDEAGFEEYRDEPWYDYRMEIIRDPVFRERLGHFLFLISTDRMEHYVAPDNVDWLYSFSNGAGSVDARPNECYHRRDGAYMVTGLETDDPYGGVIFLAPRAERDYPQ